MAEAACAAPAACRPRRAPESPLYRLAETHHETFKQVYDERFASVYGAWRAVIERTLFAFLDCGMEERAFAWVRCDACRLELRVALSCKKRRLCPLCHAKRGLLWAEWLVGSALAPVPHHHWMFTVPKELPWRASARRTRPVVRYNFLSFGSTLGSSGLPADPLFEPSRVRTFD